MERRFFRTGVELRASQGDEGSIISGYAATFDNVSFPLAGFRERLARGCFARSLQSDRSDVMCLMNHDPSLVLGRQRNRTLSLAEDAKGLRFRCILPDTTTARDVYRLIQRRDIADCSFAFTCDEDSWSEIDDPDDPDTRTALRTIQRASLLDVSVVANPAYPGTSVNSADRGRHTEFNSMYRPVTDFFPTGVPSSFPAEVRAQIQSARVIGTSRRRVLDFILS